MVELDNITKDLLRELASVSSNNALTALSDIVKKPIKLEMSNMTVVPIKEIPTVLGGPQKLVVGVYAPVTGDLSGNMMLIFGKDEASIIADLLQGKELGTTMILTPQDQRKLIEVGDKLITAYLDAFNNFLKIKTSHLNSKFISTFGESIADFALLGIKIDLKEAILLETSFSLTPPKVEGHFVLLLAISSIQNILNLIKNKLKETK